MSFLDKIGLGRKKKDLAPFKGQKLKQEQEELSLKKNPYLRAFIFLMFIMVTIFSLPLGSISSTLNYNLNQPWRSDDLTAPYTFAINKTAAELEEEQNDIRSEVPPIYRIDNSAPITIQSKLDSLYRSIQPVLESYVSWQQSKVAGSTAVFDDSLRFVNELNEAQIDLTSDSWDLLFDSFYDVQRRRISAANFAGVRVKSQLESVLDRLLESGIIDTGKGTLVAEEINVRNLSSSTQRFLNISRVRDRREANEFAQVQLSQSLNPPLAQLAMELYNKVILPNYIYNESDTQEKVAEALQTISPTKGAIAQGQVIIRKVDIVTPEKANVIDSFTQAQTSNASDLEQWIRFSGGVMAVITISMVFFMYLYLYRPKISKNNGLFFLVFLTMGLISLGSALIFRFEIGNPYVIPIAIAPIILTIIFDSRVGIIASVTLASLIGLVNGNDFEFTLATICACSMGVFSVRDIKDRAQFFFTTPGIVFITYLVMIGAFALVRLNGWDSFLNIIFFVALNSLFILFTYPIILLFEKLFGITTDFTLLEMSDTNRPLLKELMNKAPGSFHHSLQVSNLSEAAASAIQANSLLCRVGALYHDVGKMIKPEYFVENQSSGINEHDKLKPHMSAMVIKAHVSEGVKIAEEYNLPKAIIQFIESHHGTTTIRYFYEKAKEDESQKGATKEEQFKYDGPIPSSKETGILLLADGIEAASRAMKNPTYSKLESLVNRMVDDRVAEGQLSNCPLTFKDLQIIKNTFLNILVGVYHNRIEYPEDKKAEEAEKLKAQKAENPQNEISEE